MKHKISNIVLLFAFIFLLIIPLKVTAKTDKVSKQKIYMFYGEGCQHCKAETKYLNELLKDEKYKNYELERYETWSNDSNVKKLNDIAEILDVPASGIPYFIVGTNVLIGYNSTYENRIIELLDFYLGKEYQDPAGDYLHKTDTSKYDYLHYDLIYPLMRIRLLHIRIHLRYVESYPNA